MSNKKILILEGGNNEEHDVSLVTSREIQKILNQNKLKFKTLRVDPKNFHKKIINYRNFVCINSLHGPFGEDGQIQKILKKNKIPFSHSNIKSSSLCFNKSASKREIIKNKLMSPKFYLLNINDLNEKKLITIKSKLKKFVIKPNRSGSSFGIKIIKNQKEFDNLISNIEEFKKELNNHKEILIEEYISGKELTVSTIKLDKKIHALAVTEIKSKNNFFDYKAKYSKGYAKHILPAKLNKINYAKCLKFATKAHKLLGCNSLARTDFIFDTKKNKIFFLEINTQPGLTPISLLPEQANYKGLTFSEIIFILIKNLNY
ncbi:D-alanine--D-alanine ligase [Pelagibacteraceae bacterium]|nr:D-alanine--D-alanine ligase [Pelagibacteraceae bacterium]